MVVDEEAVFGVDTEHGVVMLRTAGMRESCSLQMSVTGFSKSSSGA